MSVSIKDIASALKLSKATVSWILSGQGEVKGFSDATIRRVKEYARSVNYRPNLLARSLSVGASNTVGLVVPFIDDTFYSRLARVIEARLAVRGYLLMICSSGGDAAKERELVKTLMAKQADGVIVASCQGEDMGCTLPFDSSFPHVLVDRCNPDMHSPFVIVDNYRSSSRLASALVGMGARRLVFVGTDMHLYVMRQRAEGFREGAGSCAAGEITVGRADYRDELPAAIDRVLGGCADIDGFFFATHYLALEAIRHFIRMGIDYGSRFVMGCFHETDALDVLAPRMVVSHMPVETMGVKAVDMLLAEIESPGNVGGSGVVLENEIADNG